MSRASVGSFDLVRLLAASAVMLSHSMRPFFGVADPAARVGHLTLGDIGVYVFFGLSGYLICGSLMRGMQGFAMRRAARILPGLFGCVIFCALVAAFFVPSVRGYLGSRELYTFLLNALVFPLAQSPDHALCNAAYGCSMVGPFWTLGYEVACYTLLAVLFLLFRPQARTAIIIVSTTAIFGYIESRAIAPHVLHLEAFGTMLFHMDTRSICLMLALFFVGAFIRVNRFPVFFDYRVGLAALAAFAIACRIGPVVAELTAIFAVPVAVIALGSIPSRLSTFLSERVGDLSYGVYLYHFPVQVIVWMTFYPALGAWAVAVAYATTFVLAYVSFHLIERPAMEWAREAPRKLAAARSF